MKAGWGDAPLVLWDSVVSNMQNNIGNKVIFQGFCEYTFKPIRGNSLSEAHSSKWLLPGCGKCAGQECCVKTCGKEITEEKIGLIYVIVLFVRGVIFNWGSFTSCFFQSNNKWVYAFNRNIFIFKFYISLRFYIKILFSLTTTYDIPFCRFTLIHIYFHSVSCYIINVNQR